MLCGVDESRHPRAAQTDIQKWHLSPSSQSTAANPRCSRGPCPEPLRAQDDRAQNCCRSIDIQVETRGNIKVIIHDKQVWGYQRAVFPALKRHLPLLGSPGVNRELRVPVQMEREERSLVKKMQGTHGEAAEALHPGRESLPS
jgi:hypothetical protein